MAPAKGVVAAGHACTARAAAGALRDGGNAFDAALAGLFMSTVPEAVLASLGGGGFLMAYRADTNQTILYDFFTQTPKSPRPPAELDFRAIEADFGPATQEFHIGLGASATPGFVPGMCAIHADLCRLPLADLVAPTIEAARGGVTVTPFHAYLFQVISPILLASEGVRRQFAPSGDLLKAGEIYASPGIADALELLVREGAPAFCAGQVGQAMIEQSAALGGSLTAHDLANYRVELREPLRWEFADHTCLLNPAPAAGGALIAFALSLVETAIAGGANLPPLELARIMETTNRVRQAKGDEFFIRSGAGDLRAQFARLVGAPTVSRGTTHISVIDGDGNAAAATISNGEGNGEIVGDFGFMLNNMLGEEDLNPMGFHRYEADARMSSMMAPTLLLGGDGAVAALGSGGSNRIRTAILQTVCNLLIRGMDLPQAVEAPRLHVEKCGTLSFEDLLSESERSALLNAFANAKAWPEKNMFFGGVHAVRRGAAGELEGYGDPRRCGASIVVD